MRAGILYLTLLAAACAPAPAPAPSADAGVRFEMPADLGASAPAAPQAAAAIRDVEFGDTALGTRMRSFPSSWRRIDSVCDIAQTVRSRLCEYVHDGMVYYFEGDQLVTKRIYLRFPSAGASVWPAGRPLPYGLRGNESPEEAARAIEAHTGVPMQVRIVATHARLSPRDAIVTADGRRLSIGVDYQGSEFMTNIDVGVLAPPRDSARESDR